MEKIDRKSPGNQAEEMKLRSLYILKSSLTLLEEQTEEKIPKKNDFYV